MESKKKFVLITGASSGIGCGIAVNLSSHYNLILQGRDKDRLDRTKALCDKNNEQLILPFDLTRTDELESVFSSFMADNGVEISHFIHCAGFMKMLPLKMVSLDVINKTFATNVVSATLIIRLLSQRKFNGQALKSVVLISSNISNMGAKALSIYAASKGALDAVMRCLAVELAPAVRINSILPGAVHTEMTGGMLANEELLQRMKKEYPLGLGEPADIAETAGFLISEKAKWITGQQIVVDGGRSINISTIV